MTRSTEWRCLLFLSLLLLLGCVASADEVVMRFEPLGPGEVFAYEVKVEYPPPERRAVQIGTIYRESASAERDIIATWNGFNKGWLNEDGNILLVHIGSGNRVELDLGVYIFDGNRGIVDQLEGVPWFNEVSPDGQYLCYQKPIYDWTEFTKAKEEQRLWLPTVVVYDVEAEEPIAEINLTVHYEVEPDHEYYSRQQLSGVRVEYDETRHAFLASPNLEYNRFMAEFSIAIPSWEVEQIQGHHYK